MQCISLSTYYILLVRRLFNSSRWIGWLVKCAEPGHSTQTHTHGVHTHTYIMVNVPCVYRRLTSNSPCSCRAIVCFSVLHFVFYLFTRISLAPTLTHIDFRHTQNITVIIMIILPRDFSTKQIFRFVGFFSVCMFFIRENEVAHSDFATRIERRLAFL